MNREILKTLLSEFATLNGVGSLNRANDKLAEILHLIVDHLHPAPAPAIDTTKTGMEDLKTDPTLLAKLAASIPAKVEAEVEQAVVKVVATTEVIESLAEKGIDFVEEVTAGIHQAAAEHGEPEPKVEVTVAPAVVTEAEVEPAIGLVEEEPTETEVDANADTKPAKKAPTPKKAK